MKIDVAILKNFVKKASLNGSIMTINMKFEDGAVTSSVKDYSNVSLTRTILLEDVFDVYEPMGEIFIKNTDQFIKYLNTFSGQVSLEKVDEYILKIYNDFREAYIVLGSSIVCENVFSGNLPAVNGTHSFRVNRNEFAKAFKDVDMLKINKITVVKKGKEVDLEVGEKGQSDFFISKIPANVEGVAKGSYGDSLKKVFEVVNAQTVEITMGNDVPIIVEETDEKISFTAMVAPICSGD